LISILSVAFIAVVAMLGIAAAVVGLVVAVGGGTIDSFVV